MSPYVRTVKTASGARAVQIVHSSRRGSREIEHIGSAHDEAELELLKAVAEQRLRAGQVELDLELPSRSGAAADTAGGGGRVGGGGSDPAGRLPITSSWMEPLWQALGHAYDVLGFDVATGRDEVFRQLVLARIIEPTSKLDSLRVLDEVGVPGPSYATVKRRLKAYAKDEWRDGLSKACAARAGLGPASLVLYDVTTLYFETDTGDGFREPGFSKERRLEPQITVGLLTDASGFPLLVDAFEGNKAETTTMIPTITAFMKAYNLPDVTVVADAGMVSAGNQQALEDAGLSFILGARVPDLPYAVRKWQNEHPDEVFEDQQVFVQHWPAGPTDQRRDQMIYYQYRADRARRTLRGIDTQIAKAEKAIEGKSEIKRNRFVKLSGGTRTVNRALEEKTRSLAGIKGYVTNLAACPDGTPITADFVIGAYHRLFEVEKSFRMSKHDLAARPIYHRKRDSIDAHLAVVFAALAVGRWIERTTDWSIRKFVRTARRYREITIQAGAHTFTAADPIPDDLHQALNDIHEADRGPH